MVKEFIVNIYKVMYNRELGLKLNPAIVAYVFTALFFSVFILDCLTLIEIIFHTRIYNSTAKIVSVISFSFVILTMSLLLFKVFKIEPAGDGGYELDQGVSRKIWIIYCISFAFLFILPVIRNYVFEI